MSRLVRFVPLAALLFAFIASPACGDIVYVDNLRGSDAFDGRSPTTSSDITGPARTIRRALDVARHGDTIILRNNGQPYYESMSLVGRKHGGVQGLMFTIVGNGAIIDGSDPVPAKAWRHIGGNVWRFTPWRKGFYGLFLEDKPVPEHPVKNPRGAARGLGGAAREVPKGIPAGQWSAVGGTIYYHAADKDDPRLQPLRYAARSTGLTLYNVVGVRIRDITFRNFRLDGVNAHDRCGIVKFEQVKSLNNGRSGFHIGGCSGRLRMTEDKLPTILLRECEVAGNRRNSLLFTNRGTAQVQETKLDKAATVEK